MQCPKCNSTMQKVDYINELYCPKCTECAECHKNPAVISQFYGVLKCESCQEKLRFKAGTKKMPGFVMNNTMREYYATPFWKVMGLKPTKQEKAVEREMHRRGLSYLDLQRMRNQERKHSNEQLVKDLERGELHGKPDISYDGK